MNVGVSMNSTPHDYTPLAYRRQPLRFASITGKHARLSSSSSFSGSAQAPNAESSNADYGKGMFLSIDVRSRVFTSTDASNWTQRGSVSVIRPPEVAYGNGYFVVSGNGPPEYSTTGDLWTQAPTNLFASGIVFGQGTFVLTDGPRIWQSDPVVRLDLLFAGSLALEGPVGRVYSIESAETLNTATD